MDLDLTKLSQGARYKLLTALVIPRPIAWITTYNRDRSVNAAPYSFFNVLGNRPPLVAFGPGLRPDGTRKDTDQNVERERVFVVNIVDPTLTAAMHATSASFPPHVSETESLGIATEPATSIDAPRIRDAQVHLECRLWDILQVEDNRVVMGIIDFLHVKDGILDTQNLHLEPDAFTAVGRLQGPGWYATTADRFNLGRSPPPREAAAAEDVPLKDE